MKKYCPLFLLLFIAVNCAFGQNEKFGDVPKSDLEMKFYEKDTSAAGVVLFDKVKVTIEHTVGTTVSVHKRIKIFKRSAFDFADISIQADGNIKRIKAATFNLENGILKTYDLHDSLIMKTNVNKSIRSKTFALSNVREGSVIEYEYTVENYESLYIPQWKFQTTIPVIFSEYELYITKLNDPLNTYLIGGFKPRYETKYEGKYQKWTMYEIPAFRPEPQMPDENFYLAAIRFSFLTNWEKVHQRLMTSNSFGRTVYDKYHNYFADEMEPIYEIKDDETKIKAILNLVKQKIKWDGKIDCFSDAPEEIIKRKTGSSGDINLLMANLLNSVGYYVPLLLLSTKENGLVLPDFPNPGQFNYVVCQIKLPEKTLLLDATEKLLPDNMIPERCQNGLAFSFSPHEIGWITIEPNKEKVFVSGNLSMTEDGQLAGNINYSNFEYSAFDVRKMHEDLNEEDFNKTLFNETSWSVKKTNTQNLDNIEKPLIEDFEISIPDHGTAAGDLIYFSPFVFFKTTENPFTQDTRNYPIDLGLPEEKTMMITITIPDNYVIDELPKTQITALPNNDIRYSFNISAMGNKIQITTKFQLKKTMYLTNEYPGLKEFYKRLVSKNAESIVLKRVK